MNGPNAAEWVRGTDRYLRSAPLARPGAEPSAPAARAWTPGSRAPLLERPVVVPSAAHHVA
jgi:hypothetical protein